MTSSNIREISEWLELDMRLIEIHKSNELMPAVFKDPSHIDHLCSCCQSIPWLSIRNTALEKIKQVQQALPERQIQFDSGRRREDFYEHESMTVEMTVQMACKGCHLCSLILWTLFARASEPLPLSRSDQHKSFHRRWARLGIAEQNSTLAKSELNQHIKLIFGAGCQMFGDPVAPILDVRLPDYYAHGEMAIAICSMLPPQPSREQRQHPSTLSSCRYWLDVCTQGHESCASREEFLPNLPTRVIRLNRQGGRLNAHLFIAKGMRARYAALSHQWSSSTCLLLRSNNIEALEQEIPIKNLSRTFREALELALDVGLEFVWIDSLCILQDSSADWAEESYRMAGIYSDAFLTICAFTLSDGVGFCSTSFATNLMDSACQVDRGMYVYPGPHPPPPGKEGTAHTRAWILQEELLSKRKLYCGAQTVAWVCKTMQSSHNMPWETATSGSAFDTTLINPFEPSIISSRPSTSGTQWKRPVNMFTHRTLSYDTDRLPALSAVAQAFGKCASYTESDYLAGIWRQHLPKTLLWKRGTSRRWEDQEYQSWQEARQTSDAPYDIAPSWSWISQDGIIEFFEYHPGPCTPDTYSPGDPARTKCQVLHATSVLKTSNPFGEVKSSIVTLRGRALLNPWEVIKPHGQRGIGVTYEVHFDGTNSNLKDCIMLQLDPRGALLLKKMDASEKTETLYRRVGVCLSEGLSTLFRHLKDGHWAEVTVDVV